MTIKIANALKLMTKLIDEGECCNFDELMVVDHGEGRFELQVSFDSAPRETTNFLIVSDSEHYHDIGLNQVNGDNAPVTTAIRLAGSVEDPYDLEQFEGIELPDAEDGEDPAGFNVALGGYASFPEYCDDESDGSFYGSYYLCKLGDNWAVEESRKKILDELNSAVPEMIKHPLDIIREMRGLGFTGPIANNETADLLRAALAA